MEIDQVAKPTAAAEEQSLPFVEKYRPNDLTEIISHTEIVNTSEFSIS